MDPLLRAGPHVYVDDLTDPRLGSEDERHLRRVLRLREGETLTVGDGAGAWCPARLGPSSGAGSVVPTGAIRREPGSGPVITVAVAPPSGGAASEVVQKLTEVGVDRIVLLEADRSVARWDRSRALRLIDRLDRVVREASMQSRRVYLPTVEGPMSPSAFSSRPGVAGADPDGEELDAGVTTVLIGPEGGWSAQELAGFGRTVQLGPNVLRVGTAAVAAACLMRAVNRRM